MKRFLAVLLASLMFLAAVPLAASAKAVETKRLVPTVISDVTVKNYFAPVPGQTVSDNLKKLSAGSVYYVIDEDSYYFDGTDKKACKPTDKFVVGHNYSLHVCLRPSNSNYAFSAYTATITASIMDNSSNVIAGTSDKSLYVATQYEDETKIYVIYNLGELPPTKMISAIAKGLVAPAVDCKIYDSYKNIGVPTGVNYKIYDYSWYDRTKGAEASDTFIKGHNYRLYVYFAPRTADYAFDTVSKVAMKFQMGDLEYIIPDSNKSILNGVISGYFDFNNIQPSFLNNFAITGFKAPAPGDYISTNISRIKSASENYTLTDVYWIDKTTNTVGVKTGVFVAGHNYVLSVTAKPAAGYEFKSVTSMTAPLIAGYTPVSYKYFGLTSDPTKRNVEFTIGECQVQKITSITVTGLLDPRPFDSVENSMKNVKIPDNANYKIVDKYWYDITDKKSVTTGTFVGGHEYRFYVYCEPNTSGYEFVSTSLMTATLNGKSIPSDEIIIGAKSNQRGFRYQFGKVETVKLNRIAAIGVNDPEPGASISENLSLITVPLGADYQIADRYWYDVTSPKRLDTGNFEVGHEYRLFVYFEPASGAFEFVDKASMTGAVNGITIANSYISNGVPETRRGFYKNYAKLEPTPITNVAVIGYKAPVVGEAVDGYLASLNVAANAHFSMVAQYYDSTTNEILKAADKFVADHEYILDIYVLPESAAYTFVTAANMKALLKDTSGTTVGNTADSTLKVYGVYGNDAKRCITFNIGKPSDVSSVGLLGDVDGNGRIEAKDYMLLKRYCLKTVTLTADQLKRAEISGDGKVDAKDYNLLKRHCLKTYTIVQPK